MAIPPRHLRLLHLRAEHRRLQWTQEVILAAILLEEQQFQRRRTMWVKPWLMRRVMLGQYDTLMQELMRESQGDFRSFLRIEPDMFQELLVRVTPRVINNHEESRQQTSTGTWFEVGDHPPIPDHWELLPQSGV